jgi:hypothetical protein
MVSTSVGFPTETAASSMMGRDLATSVLRQSARCGGTHPSACRPVVDRRRGVHRNVTELNADIEDWVEHWNENPKPYVWTKTADEILDNLTGYCNTINASGH